MKDVADFWNQTAKRYAKKPVANQVAYEKKLQITREYFSTNMKVLEFGC